MAERKSSGGLLDELPLDDLREQAHRFASAASSRALSGLTGKVDGLSEKVEGFAKNGGSGATGKAVKALADGESPVHAVMSAGAKGLKDKVSSGAESVKDAIGIGKKGGKGGNKVKATNIVEQIDIGAPVSVVYNAWTQFQDFPKFMKKVEGVEQKDETKLDFKAKILWSHRTWQATIVDQIPDHRIVWRSSGPKGHVDGAVTFHEIGPDLTRVLVVLEYFPQGLFERTGNLWRAQGRRARLELKHFRRHVMTDAMLHPDDLDGWRGRIEDSEVREEDQDQDAEDQDAEDQDAEDQDAEDRADEQSEDEADDEYDDDDLEDEYDDEEDGADEADDDLEEEYDDDEEDDDLDDEYDDDEDEEDDDLDDEYDEDGADDEDDEQPARARRRVAARGR